jgi:hypothetical protein
MTQWLAKMCRNRIGFSGGSPYLAPYFVTADAVSVEVT